MQSQINGEYEEISDKEIFEKINKWVSYFKTQWVKIFIFSFLGGCLGFFYAWMQPVTYTARLTFVVDEGKNAGSSLGGLASLAGQFGVDVGGASGGGLLSSDNILLYFKSINLSREVMLSRYDSSSSKSFADEYALKYNFKLAWSKNKMIGNVNFLPICFNKPYSRLQDSLLQKMIASVLDGQFLISKVDKKAGFIEVSTNMKDEKLAKIYCERIVQIAVEKYVLIKTQRQKITVDKLQMRLDSITKLLNQKTSSSASLQTSTSTMDINPLYKSGTAVITEKTLRDKSMLVALYSSITQNLELAKFNLSQETPVVQIVDSPIFPLQRYKISRAKTAIIWSLISSLLALIILVAMRLFKHFD